MPTYVLKNKERLGPFDDAMIFNCLADGRFLYEDLAWREGWPDWRQLREVYPAPTQNNPKDSDPAPDAQNADAIEETVWTGQPSWWNYWDRWALGAGSIGFGIGMQLAAGKRWFADYPHWNDVQPWVPLIAFASIGIAMAIFASSIIARQRLFYTVTNKRLVMRWGLFARSMEEIRVQDIKSINVSKTGLSGFLLDIGTVEFSSAATDMAAVTFWQITDPYKVRDLVRKLQS